MSIVGKKKGWYKKKGVSEVDLLTGLKAWWELDDEAGSTVKDETGNHNGTSYNITGIGKQQAGILNKCYLIDNTAEHIAVPDSDDLSFTDGVSDKPFSISAWVKFTSLSISSYIVAKYNGAGTSEYFLHHFPTDPNGSSLWFRVATPDGSGQRGVAVDDSFINIGQWYHFVGTYDGSGLASGFNFYVDGVIANTREVNTGTYTGMVNGNSNLHICNITPTSGAHMHGYQDQTAIWGKELTQQEVTDLYNDGNGITYLSLQGGIVAGATVNLDAGDSQSYGGSGTDWLDLSGNNYDAVLANGVGYDSANGGVLTFDGVNDKVLGNTGYTVSGSSALTLEIWFYLDDYTYYDYPGLFTQKRSDYSRPLACFLTNNTGGGAYNLKSLCLTWGDNEYKIPTNSILEGVWNQLVITYNGSGTNSILNHVIYVNSISQTISISNAGVYTNENAISTPIGTYPFKGKIPIFNLYLNKEFTQEEVTQNFDFYKNRFGLDVDTDAQAFIDATGITNPTQQSAIDTLVKGLKDDGLWTKMKAIYPFVGGTADTHKYNLKDPRDLDVAFRLTPDGTITHSSTGVKASGAVGIGLDTHLIPSDSLLLNSTSIGYYSRENVDSVVWQCMGSGLATGEVISMYLRFTDGNSYGRINDAGYASGSTLDSLGLFVTSRTSNSLYKIYKRGSIIGSSSNTTSIPITTSIGILGIRQSGSFVVGEGRECAFSFIADGLTDQEVVDLNTLVQAYQTTLNREV